MSEVLVASMGAVGFVLLVAMVLAAGVALVFLALGGKKGRHR